MQRAITTLISLGEAISRAERYQPVKAEHPEALCLSISCVEAVLTHLQSAA